MSQATTPLPQKVDNIWFDDGNLIVIAEPKVFRLYQGLLSKRSPIFKDMLSVPQPDASTAIDVPDRRIVEALNLDIMGCAVVRLTDNPQEVEWFFSAFLQDYLSIQYSTNTSALTEILRLAEKYKVNFLRKWAVGCLEKLYPFTSIVDIDELLRIQQRKDEDLKWMNGMFPLISVAMTVGVPWILPCVFWQLLNVTLSDTLQHHEWSEFAEERKTQYLLGREYINEVPFGSFDLVLGLHCDDSLHSPLLWGLDCDETFEKALNLRIRMHGPNATHDELWKNYVDESGCSECKEEYASRRREMIMDVFVTLQQRNGLPDSAKMMELREKYYEDVSINE